jgi:class 3 adenylate cyclase
VSDRSPSQSASRLAPHEDGCADLGELFSPLLAAAITALGREQALKTHRREVCVMFVDLRGFTAFTERAEPEEVTTLLRAYHAMVGGLLDRHGGMLERFAGDGMMAVFNDPVPLDCPEQHAVRMALAAQAAFPSLAHQWKSRGYEIGLACGLAQGFATLGPIGFPGRWDYAAIGSVTNLAARLCAQAADGQVLVERKLFAAIQTLVEARAMGPVALKGFAHAVEVFAVEGLRASALPVMLHDTAATSVVH